MSNRTQMRKKIVIIGLVLLIVGIALFYGGGVLGVKGLSASPTFKELKTGEWNSTAVVVSSGELLVLTSSTNQTYLVHSSDIGVVSKSNVKNYEINGTETTTGGVTTLEFTSITPGNYNIVAFGSKAPSVTLIKNSINSLLLELLPLIIGGVLGFVGFIVLIVGLVLRKKQLPPNQEMTY